MSLRAHSTVGEKVDSKKSTTSPKENKNSPESTSQSTDGISTKSRKRTSILTASDIVEPPTKIEKNDDLVVAPITQASALVFEDKGPHAVNNEEISGKKYLLQKMLTFAAATVPKPNKAVTKQHVAVKSSRKEEMDSEMCKMEIKLMELVGDANKTTSSRQNPNLHHDSSFRTSTKKFAQVPMNSPGMAVPSPGTYTTWTSEQVMLFVNMCKQSPGSSVGVLKSLPMIDGTPIMQDAPSSSPITSVNKDSNINNGPEE
ncbi:hypothetical protein CAEBREN_04477 [Caenorhabditis brenneri]|uniref:Uncharacterized protein n=1 Tax=Caenorhabditis brenneri TaxID=135651 RepID=G0NUD1_CAEBE|nr:hypothetical protein CAEBREN_04477 [Caenorhabditis brenneri]